MKLKLSLLSCLLSLPTLLFGINPEVVVLAAMTLNDGNGVIYSGNNRSSHDIVCTVKNGLVYEGDGTFASRFDALYTIKGDRIYYGNSISPYDIAYTIKKDKVFEGDGRFLTMYNILYTIKGQSIYKGDSTYLYDMICTIKNDKVYEGDGRFATPFNALYTIEYGGL